MPFPLGAVKRPLCESGQRDIWGHKSQNSDSTFSEVTRANSPVAKVPISSSLGPQKITGVHSQGHAFAHQYPHLTHTHTCKHTHLQRLILIYTYMHLQRLTLTYTYPHSYKGSPLCTNTHHFTHLPAYGAPRLTLTSPRSTSPRLCHQRPYVRPITCLLLTPVCRWCLPPQLSWASLDSLICGLLTWHPGLHKCWGNEVTHHAWQLVSIYVFFRIPVFIL